ncbi:hypothetical protein [Aeromonas cavernicola]|uniref:Outer membrane protein beta-barrel domain-containing protein n=1 Tax=Aeromonas cavernicola TaxID=1006623 RepID=A0A2H9U7I4_9GAMM|nr:hypothetical protein [Aeromonas cavernicola]PJG59961.1 hypothetical protein CUC53_04500 [Aeromonas cavernicola]
MLRSLITLLISCTSMTALAAGWDQFRQESNPALYIKSYSGVLLNSAPHHNDSFDLWLVNSGYRYPVIDNLTLFMEAGPAVASQNRESGFNLSSGLRYQLSPVINISSQIKHLELNRASTLLELHSSMLLTPRLSVTANYGVAPVTAGQALSLGVGFNF